ncbi:hypothetical protein BS47DRAFT_1401592 [Hydnum rufescens UP504]|uniref:Uncharacterized protein n=1 Tax=Hydnum rufescens UP504 TaxID=1448309 RepID=A0A9P6AG09_9AGAM|nr:hypothetical protein BS47DRAFT_1401592 [Hydnum rufescens UP504]
MPPKTYQARKRTTRPAATPAGRMARSSTITNDTAVPSTSSESASGPQTRESSDTTGEASSTPITRPVPQRNEWFIDVPSLRSHQQTVQLAPPRSRNHPSVPTSIPYSSNPAGHSPSPAGSPLHFLVFLVLNHPVFLVLNHPVFLVLNRPVFLVLNPRIPRSSPYSSCSIAPYLAHRAQSRNRSRGHPRTRSPAQSPAQAATWSPQPPSHTSSHTFGNSPFVGDFDHEVEPSGLYHQRENSVILDPPNPNDGNPDVEDDDSVAEEGDTAQIKSQGGPFTDEQVAEIRGIVESMNRELEHKAKEWDRPLESVMRIGNLAISMRERRSAGNPWNAYQASYEKDPKPDHPHHEYVEKVIQPAYRELIAAHGGEDSDAWKKKLKELVDQHNASKAAQAFDIALSPAAMGKVIKQTTKRWKDDLKWMATMNIHRFCGIVSGVPDEVASKQNALFTGSPAMKDWLNLSFPKDSMSLKMIHSHILVYQGQHLLRQNQKQKIPKSMHLMRKEISEELNNLLTPLISRVPRIPWASLPRFLANNELKIENWVAESEFPSLLSLDVSVVRTESWKKLWRTFFQPSDDSTKVRVTQLKHIAQENNGKLPSDTVIVSDQFNNPLLTVAQVDGPGEPNESDANSANGTSVAGGASGPRKRASQGDGPSRKKKKMGPKHPMSAEFIDEPSDDDGPVTDTFENPGGASSVGGQSSGTTWGGAGSSVDGVVNGQFSGNAPSGAINGPMDWAGGYGQNQQEYNPHDDPLMASLFARYPDLNLGLNQGFDDGFPL